MEGKRNKLIIIFFLLIHGMSMLADSSPEIYKAYVTNRMDLWKSVIDRMQNSAPENNDALLELINYQYGYIGYCVGFNKEKEARQYLLMAEDNLSRLEKSNFRIPVLNAYRSAFYAFRISLNSISAPFNGPKSLNHAKKAVELDSKNYFGYIQLGNAYFYMPSSFGGSKKIAFENFTRARNLMENEPGLTKGNWNYLSLLVTIAQSYAYLEEYEKAKAEYENILKIEPGFLYVKNDLYPKLIVKMKNKNE